MRLFDAIGRTVYSNKLSNVKSDKFEIDLTNIAPGTYHIVAVSVNGLISKSIVVTK